MPARTPAFNLPPPARAIRFCGPPVVGHRSPEFFRESDSDRLVSVGSAVFTGNRALCASHESAGNTGKHPMIGQPNNQQERIIQ